MQAPGEVSDIESRFMQATDIPPTVMACGVVRHCEAGETVVREGERVDGCYCVLSGRVCGFTEDESGTPLTLISLDSGSCFLESDIILDSYETQCGFRMSEQGDLLFVSREDFERIVGEDMQVAQYFMRRVSLKFHAFVAAYRDAGRQSAMRRVCDALIDLAVHYGLQTETGITIRFPLSQQYLADFLGVSRVTVNKCMGELKRSGMLSRVDGEYCIRDLAALKRRMALLA